MENKTAWFDSLEARCKAKHTPPAKWWQDADYWIALLFVLFLVLCAADIV